MSNRSAGEKEAIDYSKRVSQRGIETYDRMTTRLGSWILTPGLEIEGVYQSNVYATETDEESDFITILKPRVQLSSDWSVHKVNLELGADIGFYADFTDENFEDYHFSNDNRFEIVRGTNLITDFLYRSAHEARSSPDNLSSTVEPLTYELLTGTLGLERDLAKLGLRVDVKASSLAYDDSRSITGRTIDNSFRDYTTIDGGIRLSYKPIPKTEAYLSSRLLETSYDDSTSNGGPDRDSWGYEFKLGAKKSLDELWSIDAYLGYAPSFFDDDSLEDVTGGRALIIGSSVLWSPTALTSVVGDLRRATYQTTESGASAVVNTSLSMRVEHKLTQSLLLDGSLGYSYADYYGSSREDDNYNIGFGVQYYMTRLVSVRTAYEYNERDSSQDGSSYKDNVASLQLRLNY
ncbi:hypothetical protein CKO27_18660 [Thiocystis violacea]|nr:hypothetical protein [Thiocystis violacea]